MEAFDTVPRDVLFVVLAKFGVPPHLIRVIKRMNTDLQVTFDLNGEPVAVPCTVGVKQGCPLRPTLFLFVMQACLESLEKAMPADAKLQFQTNTRTEGKNGGHVSGTDWSNKGEFTFSFWASLYADDAATPLASRAALLGSAVLSWLPERSRAGVSTGGIPEGPLVRPDAPSSGRYKIFPLESTSRKTFLFLAKTDSMVSRYIRFRVTLGAKRYSVITCSKRLASPSARAIVEAL